MLSDFIYPLSKPVQSFMKKQFKKCYGTNGKSVGKKCTKTLNWVLKLIVTSSLSGIFQPKIIKLNITVELPLSSNNFCKIIMFVKCQTFA